MYTFDILQGPAGDLLRLPVRRRIRTLLRSGMCCGLFAGVPCTSFSRARGGGVNAIRSTARPQGLPNLSAFTQAKVDEGNHILQISCQIFRLCHRLGVSFVWENTWSSFQWDHSLSIEIENLSGVKDIKLNQCAFGARWYKPTRLRTFGLSNTTELEKKCR